MKLFLLILLQFSLPLKHLTLTSNYGYRIHPVTGNPSFHSGIDLKAHNDTVFAIANGIVTAASYQPYLGIYIRVEHNGLQSLYGHLSQIFVAFTEEVAAGQPIGITGSTGRVTGEHLHFGVYFKGKPINPVQFLYQILKNQNHE
jgi:murein DD-endopeptidase MepM/ murein hydrolase activator NlpD